MSLALFACTDNEIETHYVQASSDPAPSMALPEALRRTSLAKNNLSAFLTVDGERKEMSIGNDGVATYKGDISPGSNELALEVFYNSASFTNPVPLVSALRTFNIANGSTVSFIESDYNYHDEDGDLYTNIRELEANTSIFDNSDAPGDDNYEDNGSPGDAYNITGLKSKRLDLNLPTKFGLIDEQDTQDFYEITIADGTASFDVDFWLAPGIDAAIMYNGNNVFETIQLERINDAGFENGFYLKLRVSNPPAGNYIVPVFMYDAQIFSDENSSGIYFLVWE